MHAIDAASVAIGRVARGGFAWIVAAAAIARRRDDPLLAVETAASAWLADLAAVAASHLIGRERPCRTGPSLIECPSSPSLPSNHAATATAAALTLTRREPRLAPVALAAAAAVGASRVRVGVHHRSDVAAGAVLGVGVSLAVAAAAERVSWTRVLRALLAAY